jgi:hypothetical protein
VKREGNGVYRGGAETRRKGSVSAIFHLPDLRVLLYDSAPPRLRGKLRFAGCGFTRGSQTKMGLGWNQALHRDTNFDLRSVFIRVHLWLNFRDREFGMKKPRLREGDGV